MLARCDNTRERQACGAHLCRNLQWVASKTHKKPCLDFRKLLRECQAQLIASMKSNFSKVLVRCSGSRFPTRKQEETASILKEIIFNKDLSSGSTAKAEAKTHVPVTQLPSRNPGRTERTLASSYKRAAEH